MSYQLKELESWKKARELRILVSNYAKTLPSEEKFRLKDQIIRSSRSVAANIAEGYGHYHYQENIQFCRLARGSLFETEEHLICAKDENYISQKRFEVIMYKIKECLKILNGYISYLKKQKVNVNN